MLSNRIIVALLAALLAASTLHCASKPFATGATIDTEYDFAKVHTFAFARVPRRPLASANGKILRAAVDEALKARGFREVSEADADIWIAYDIGILSSSSVSWGAQSTLGQGRIIVRAIDPATEREVWYGWGEAHLRAQPDPERRIREAVAALFEDRVGTRDAS
jgi:hypothetical protein